MQRNTWGGIKFSRYWERHCDGHKPPGPLLGACTQLRRCCRRKKTPGKTWPNWLRDLAVSRSNVGCGTAAAAGLLGSEVLKSNRQGQAGCLEVTLFSKGKRSYHLTWWVTSTPFQFCLGKWGIRAWPSHMEEAGRRHYGRGAVWAQRYHLWGPASSSWLCATKEKLKS